MPEQITKERGKFKNKIKEIVGYEKIKKLNSRRRHCVLCWVNISSCYDLLNG